MYRVILLYILLFICTLAYGSEDIKSVIVPVDITQVKDSVANREVYAILNGSTDNMLKSFRVKEHNTLIVTTHKGWSFYTLLLGEISKKKKSRELVFNIGNQHRLGLLGDILFFHEKYMYKIGYQYLSEINKEIQETFGDKPLTCVINSYISKDHYRNYLNLSFEQNGRVITYTIIIIRSEFYKCVVTRGWSCL